MDILNKLNIIPLHEKGITGKGVKIAYLGYGCALTEKIKVTKKIVIPTWGCKKEDANGFGTIFCSLLTGKDIGICPDIELYDVKIASDGGSVTWSDAKKGLQWCYDNNIDIVNLMYINANDDSMKTLVKQCVNKGMLLISNAASEPTGSTVLDKSQDTLTVSYVKDDKTFLDNNSSKTPPIGSWVDCVGYGWGLQIIDSKLEQRPYGNGEWSVHQYYCNFAMAQVMGICALLKQQNPNLKTAYDIRSLLSELCEPLYGEKIIKLGTDY